MVRRPSAIVSEEIFRQGRDAEHKSNNDQQGDQSHAPHHTAHPAAHHVMHHELPFGGGGQGRYRLPCGRPRLKRMVSLLGLNRRRADALLSYAADLNAEMLVVGGYGHSGSVANSEPPTERPYGRHQRQLASA
jgi:hypothetical protein